MVMAWARVTEKGETGEHPKQQHGQSKPRQNRLNTSASNPSEMDAMV